MTDAVHTKTGRGCRGEKGEYDECEKDVRVHAFAAIHDKGTTAAQFPIESVYKTHAREQVPLYMELDAMKRVEADTKEGASRWSGRGLRGTRSEAERVGARQGT